MAGMDIIPRQITLIHNAKLICSRLATAVIRCHSLKMAEQLLHASQLFNFKLNGQNCSIAVSKLDTVVKLHFLHSTVRGQLRCSFDDLGQFTRRPAASNPREFAFFLVLSTSEWSYWRWRRKGNARQCISDDWNVQIALAGCVKGRETWAEGAHRIMSFDGRRMVSHSRFTASRFPPKKEDEDEEEEKKKRRRSHNHPHSIIRTPVFFIFLQPGFPFYFEIVRFFFVTQK